MLDPLRHRVTPALEQRRQPAPLPAPLASEAEHIGFDPASSRGRRAAVQIFELLDEIDSISSRMRDGIEILMGEHPLSDREQLLAALALDCEITIDVGHLGSDAPDALFQKIIDLGQLMTRETNVEFVFSVECPRDRERFTHLWMQARRLPHCTPPFVEPTAKDPHQPADDVAGT